MGFPPIPPPRACSPHLIPRSRGQARCGWVPWQTQMQSPATWVSAVGRGGSSWQGAGLGGGGRASWAASASCVRWCLLLPGWLAFWSQGCLADRAAGALRDQTLGMSEQMSVAARQSVVCATVFCLLFPSIPGDHHPLTSLS